MPRPYFFVSALYVVLWVLCLMAAVGCETTDSFGWSRVNGTTVVLDSSCSTETAENKPIISAPQSLRPVTPPAEVTNPPSELAPPPQKIKPPAAQPLPAQPSGK